MSQNVGAVDPSSWAALEEMPLGMPPPGVNPSSTGGDYNGHMVLIAGTIGFILALISLFGRLYAKIFIFKKLTLDDYIYMISWPFGIALIALEMSVILGGAYGHHTWDVLIKDLTMPVLLRSLILETLFGPFLWFSKLTLFSLILTAFAPLRHTKALVYVGIIVSGILYCGSSMALGVTCGPQGGTNRQAYLAGMAGKACSSTTGSTPRMSILQGVTSVITDLYIFILPLPAVWKLRLPFTRKVAIAVVFLVAFGACISSIVGLYFRTTAYGTNDITFSESPIFVACIVEITVGLMVPCAASFAKIYRKHKSTVTPTFISTLRSRRERKEPVILGRDEMVLYSTQVSSGWKDLSSVSSYQPKSTDLPCVETAH